MKTFTHNNPCFAYSENKDGVLEAPVLEKCEILLPGGDRPAKKVSADEGDKLVVTLDKETHEQGVELVKAKKKKKEA
jgi:hypothetical protein